MDAWASRWGVAPGTQNRAAAHNVKNQTFILDIVIISRYAALKSGIADVRDGASRRRRSPVYNKGGLIGRALAWNLRAALVA